MKKLIKILVIVFIVIVLAVVVGLFLVNNYVQSPAFKERILSTARSAVGSEVKISDLQVSLFSGVTAKGIAIENPKGISGQLLGADAFVLRYKLWPLLHKELVIEDLELVKPAIGFSRGADGKWNYEAMMAPSTATPAAAATTPAAQAPTTPVGTGGMSSPVNVTLSNFNIKNGAFTMTDENKKLLMGVTGLDVHTAASLENGKLNGSGSAKIETINVADKMFVRSVSSPIDISSKEIKLPSLKGTVADGQITGDATLKLEGGSKYLATVQIKDADVDKLLTEAGVAKKVINGKLQITTHIEGTGGLPTMAGQGKAEIVGGKLAQMPLQNLISTLLLMPDLQQIQFDECRVEFTIADNVMQTPVISLKSAAVQVTGSGSISLQDYSLNHQMTLALAPGMVSKVPKEIRGIFTQRPDGFYTISFKVWGPYDNPQTDLKDRLIKGGAEELLKKGLDKLFK